MKDFVKRLIDEHKELGVKLEALNAFLENDELTKNIDKKEYANLCAQHKAMTDYYDILTVRLSNNDILFEFGEYFERVKDNYNEQTPADKKA